MSAEETTNTAAVSSVDTTEDLLLNMDQYAQQAMEWLVNYLPSVLSAILIFVIGRFIAKRAQKFICFLLEKRKSDPILVSFIGNLIYYILIIMVSISAIGELGIQTTSLVAVFGAAGLAIGLALQGSLSNFASGVLILIFRPFKLDDFIEAGGATGIVKEIGILVTILCTPDNKKIIIPNSAVMGGNIINFTANGQRRVDMVFGISYGDDIDKARQILTDVVNANPKILKDPSPQIALSELGDSSVNFVVRPWAEVPDYWDIYFDTHEKVKKAFDQEGISIPFPQRDVHLFQEKA